MVKQGFDAVDKRFDGMDARFGEVEGRYDTRGDTVNNVGGRMKSLPDRDFLTVKLVSHNVTMSMTKGVVSRFMFFRSFPARAH